MGPLRVCANGHVDSDPANHFCLQCGQPLKASESSVDPPAMSTSTGQPSSAQDESRRRVWPTFAIAILAVLVVGAGTAYAATELSKSSTSTANSIPPGSTTAPTGSTTTTAAPSSTVASDGASEAAALNSLLGNSAVDRSAIDSAVQAITNCGDLGAAQQTLSQASTSRRNLLAQLDQLQTGAIPGGSELLQALRAAWEASLSSDNSYGAYAGDELSNINGCTPNDSADANAQAAGVSDGQATAAKNQVVSLWAPIAAVYGLPQWQQNQI